MPEDGLLSDDVIRTERGLLLREQQVIGLTVDGYSSAESAQIIGISEPAFKLHVTSIWSKLGVANQFELIVFALHYQLVDANETFPSDDGQCPRLR
jgi:DNA-binding CsgD family transcriptional regulator